MQDFFRRVIPAGSAILMATTLGSYIVGLLRDRIFAQTYGLSSQLDAYNAAFLLPDFFFNLLVASGIAAAVVPLFSDLKQQDKKDAYGYLNSIISASMLLMVGVSLLLVIFAGPAAALVAPGLSADDQQLTTRLIRLLALSPILFAASNALGAALITEKRFLFYGLSPIFYNIGIIGGTLYLAPSFGVVGTAIGTIIGAILHAVVRGIDAWRSGWRPAFSAQWNTKEFRTTVRLMIPKMVGHPIELVTFWMFTAIASTLTAGSISALNFARNFQSVPVSIIGISISTAVFPVLANAMSRKSPQEYHRTLWQTLSIILGLSTLAAMALYVIREPLVSILLGGGEFGSEDAARTAGILGAFCLAVPTESTSHLLARAFYAKKNTLTPVVFSVISLAIAVGSALLMLPALQLYALPIGFFLGSLTKVTGLTIVSYRQRA
ncbi:MAG: murein biosynthesis integral membrane protein MurJ [Candidatus Andersenbacteria bacterium]